MSSQTSYQKFDEMAPHCGWLSPSGEHFPCDWQGHQDLAFELTSTMSAFNPNLDDAQRWLEENGWLKIVISGQVMLYDEDLITTQQINTVTDFMLSAEMPKVREQLNDSLNMMLGISPAAELKTPGLNWKRKK